MRELKQPALQRIALPDFIHSALSTNINVWFIIYNVRLTVLLVNVNNPNKIDRVDTCCSIKMLRV